MSQDFPNSTVWSIPPINAQSPAENAPNTSDSSLSKASEHPSTFLNVSPRGPRNCTQEDLRTMHKQRLISNPEDGLIDKECKLDEEGFISVKGKRRRKM